MAFKLCCQWTFVFYELNQGNLLPKGSLFPVSGQIVTIYNYFNFNFCSLVPESSIHTKYAHKLYPAQSICFFFIDYQNLCCSADTSGLHTQITLRASGLNETVLSLWAGRDLRFLCSPCLNTGSWSLELWMASILFSIYLWRLYPTFS